VAFAEECEQALRDLLQDVTETNACLLEYQHDRDDSDNKGTVYANAATRVRDFALQIKVSNNIL